MHRCPGPECEQEVAVTMLACPGHWYQVPKAVRDAVWREYKRGPLSAQHQAAMGMAIKAMRPIAAGEAAPDG
jgi:hypothetical protein